MVDKKKKNSESTQRMLVIGGIVAAVVVALTAVLLLSGGTGSTYDYSDIPMNRTDDGAFILGEQDAPITVVAFEDFMCPHCQSYQTTIHQFIDEYVATGQAKFEFRMLATSQFSALPFSLAECAAEIEEGSFWQAHDVLFQLASTSLFDERSAREFAEEMGISYSDLLDCQGELNTPQFEADQQLVSQVTRQNPNSITGTPAVAWRLNDGALRFDVIPRQPTAEQLGALVEAFGN